MPARPEYRPVLTGDPAADSAALGGLLATGPPGTVHLPPGVHPLAGGLTVPAGWRLTGAPAGGGVGTWLISDAPGGTPLLHVVGSDVEIDGIGLTPAPSAPGEHAGDRGTAITIGNYLYPDPPAWIERVRISGVQVRRRPGDREANSVAVMGAVRDADLEELTIAGGRTGLAVHWGAVGDSVATLTAPTYHPHRLTVTGLRVAEAYEGFYLSSVHDVTVTGARLDGVDIGFRLLAGDNTDRLYPVAGTVGRDIHVSDVAVTWHGDLYAVRIAGWGRSEVDGLVSTLDFADVTIRDLTLTALDAAGEDTPRSRAPIVLEAAHGVTLHNVTVGQRR